MVEAIVKQRSVFELVDESHEEYYWPLGVFRSAIVATLEVYAHVDRNEWGQPPCSDRSEDDMIRLVLRERTFGFSECGEVIWQKVWTRSYAGDDTAWTESV